MAIDIKCQWVTPKNANKNEFLQRFPNLASAINADNSAVRTGSSISSVNGLLDEKVMQYKTGDCWLVAGLYSLAATDTGKQIIKESVTVNDNSSVTVDFKGIGASYTISESELNRYDTDNNTYDSYSNGDNDVLAFELATEKLWKDINSGKVSLNSNNSDITYTGEGNGIDDGGLPSQMVYYLTGIEPKEYYNYDMRDLSSNTVNRVLKIMVILLSALLFTIMFIVQSSLTAQNILLIWVIAGMLLLLLILLIIPLLSLIHGILLFLTL